MLKYTTRTVLKLLWNGFRAAVERQGFVHLTVLRCCQLNGGFTLCRLIQQ